MELKIVNYRMNGAPYLMDVCNRAMDFCKNYDSDADPKKFANAIAAAYFQDFPGLMPFVLVDDDGMVVSHAIATIENYYGGIAVNIAQFVVDRGTSVPQEAYDAFFEVIVEWARKNNAKEIRMQARNRAVARVLSRLGFEESERVQMKWPVI